MTTDIHHPTPAVDSQFSDEETHALEAVRIRFQQDHDVLSAREREYLCFLRWLVRSGRLQAAGRSTCGHDALRADPADVRMASRLQSL
jgi:hypothetical protein